MKFIIEANIPYIRGIFEPFAQVEYLAPEMINHASVSDADALIVRTRTKCDKKLLHGSKCKFIGTATIGTDHIDLDYCKSQDIKVVNAPGCNAPAVAQYVMATIGRLMKKLGDNDPNDYTLGIIGVGNVGKIISQWAQHIGFRVLENDPPRQRAEGGYFVSLDEVKREADFITFHTPLTHQGEDKTYHLANDNFFDSLGKCKLVINSARGEIVDNTALKNAINAEKIEYVAIDCWENEPDINLELLKKVYVGTPHIAGYSSEGKHRATDMIVAAVTSHFNLPLELKEVDMGNDTHPQLEAIIESYNPAKDTEALRENPQNFEALRNHYDLRKEVR